MKKLLMKRQRQHGDSGDTSDSGNTDNEEGADFTEDDTP